MRLVRILEYLCERRKGRLLIDPPPPKGTAEDIISLYKRGVISLDELRELISDDEIEMLHRNGELSDTEYNNLTKK